jgi:hypothetical protein
MNTKPALTSKQTATLVAILTASGNLPDNHVERPKTVSIDVVRGLRRQELADSKGKYVWITKAGIKALNGAVPVENVISDGAKAVKKLAVQKAKSGELNWAYRRLRRQAYIYFGRGLKRDGLTGNLKMLRDDMDAVSENYTALRDKMKLLVDNDNKLAEMGDWDTFMNDFFGHVIHPGARSKTA